MKASLAKHDTLLRRAIEDHRGYVFKTVGDAFCAAFSAAGDALQAALAAQRGLLMEDWGDTPIRVRMALHSGAAEERDGDYFGPPVNLVARLLSAGHGGQVLLSQATRELLRSVLPAGVSVRDFGEHHLKDIAQPEHIFQLDAPDLPGEFPPLKTIDALPNNLPADLTNFIGRQQELDELKGLLTGEIMGNGGPRRAPRLVTLIGPGGTGKTRLSLQVGVELLSSFTDGVWLIELAPVRDPSLLPVVIMAVLGIRDEANEPPETSLVRRLSNRHILLILDNCEHLVVACAKLADLLLRHCPNLTMLSSSRESLGIAGEVIFPVHPLALPELQPAYTPDSALESDAVRLFVDRAAAVRAGFHLTVDNVDAVIRVCRRLDGIPLAIELAAARTRMLKVDQIAERLDDRFRLLTAGARVALPHHQTLRATIDWSYDLLSVPECVLFRRLSVFAGGWQLEDAEEVCAGKLMEDGDALDSVEIFDLMDRLIGKSLVLVDYGAAEAARYQMLETIRQYAAEKLDLAGETKSVSDRHLNVFLRLVEEAAHSLEGAEQALWMNRLEGELDNLRAALRWARLGNCGDLGPRLALGLVQFWYTRGYFREGRDQLDLMLPLAVEGVAQRARLLEGIAFLARYLGDYNRVYEAITESLAIWRELGDRQGEADSLVNLGYASLYDGRFDEARPLYEESLAINRLLDNQQGIADATSHLGVIAFYQGDYGAATEYHNESLAIWRTLGDRKGIAYALRHLADTALQAGLAGDAYRFGLECLLTSRELEYREGICGSLEVFAGLAARRDPPMALRLLGAAATLRATVGIPLAGIHQPIVAAWVRPAWEALGAAAESIYAAARQTVSVDQATDTILNSPDTFL
jgi:predicted ATPase